MKDWKGTGVALITPFSNGQVDYEALARIIDHVIDGGVEYLVTLGTTGEAVTLSEDEQQEILRFTVKKANGRRPVVAGFGGNDTAELCNRVKRFDTSGVAAILSSSPAYNKPSQEGLYRHYMELAGSTDLPIIIYNVPGRTASNISDQTTVRLAKASKQFVGIKEASGDLQQATRILRDAPDNFHTISGDDPTALALLGIGGQGVISVIANALPRAFSDMIRAALEGNWKKARALHYALFDLHTWLYVDGNPVGIKATMNELGLCKEELRLPLVPMQNQNREKLAQSLAQTQKALEKL